MYRVRRCSNWAFYANYMFLVSQPPVRRKMTAAKVKAPSGLRPLGEEAATQCTLTIVSEIFRIRLIHPAVAFVDLTLGSTMASERAYPRLIG
jgi:hypothetical protein